jgi:hypothetical protein
MHHFQAIYLILLDLQVILRHPQQLLLLLEADLLLLIFFPHLQEPNHQLLLLHLLVAIHHLQEVILLQLEALHLLQEALLLQLEALHLLLAHRQPVYLLQHQP